MKKTPEESGRINKWTIYGKGIAIPITTLAASVFWLVSSVGAVGSDMLTAVERRVSLRREPLKPTKEMPAITVTNESHLEQA